LKGETVNFTLLINIFLGIVCPIVALAFFVRLLCAPFLPKVWDQMRRYRIIHIVWGVFAVVWFLIIFVFMNPMVWPPDWMERRAQRAKVEERVLSAGGWAALQKDCDALAAEFQDGGFHWSRGHTNALPKTIAALNPWEVLFDPPSLMSGSKDKQQTAVVQIKVFGMHSTGGRSAPYFGFEVVSGTNADGYRPSTTGGGVSGNSHHSYAKVTDRIYEVY
jgi:hypothetical protein